MTRNRLLPALTAALLLAVVTLPAAAGDIPGTTAAKSYGEWSAEWWQWLLTLPAADSPQTAHGPIDCGVGQGGAVWFLAGAPAGTTAERSCTVPRGKALFFPVLNALSTNDSGQVTPVAQKRDGLDRFISDLDPGPLTDLGLPGTRFCDLFATLDGISAPRLVSEARAQSPAFAVDSAEGRGGLPPGIVDPEAVSDGFWVMLPPLAPGEHTLRFGGRICTLGGFADHPFFPPVDVTYHLTVTDGEVAPAGAGPVLGERGQRNLRIIESLYQAFAAGDLDTVLDIIDEDVVWIESEGIPYGGTFIGRDAVVQGVFAKIGAEWDNFTAEVSELIDAGKQVVTVGQDSGTYKATGLSMTAPTLSVWTLNNKGKVVQFRQVIDTQAVMSAVEP